MALSPGTRLGHYEIGPLRGAGGMGEVYRSRDVRLDRTVAIKVLPSHVASDPDFRRRFDREARAVAALAHPHICVLYDVGEAPNPGHPDGAPVQFLVMEYLDGESLDEVLRRKTLTTQEALRFAIQIADALDKAHRKGIVHRDLKPGNIMVTSSGAKLLDFGLAKSRPAVSGASTTIDAAAPLTEQGTIVGTPHYMSPEQIEGRDVDGRSDIFSLGAILYEMTTGKKAFDGASAAAVMAAILEREPRQISQLQPGSSPLLEHVVTRCLVKNPDERWQTAADVMRELAWVADPPPLITAPPPTTARSRWLERLAWLLALAAVAAIAALRFGDGRTLTTRPSEQRLEITTPPTFDALSLAVSPDGANVVFVANKDGRPTLWLRALNAVDARPLAGTDNAQFPFWSPDNRSIGFAASGQLKRIDLEGGAIRPLASAPLFLGGTWTTNGTILFVPNTNSRVFSVPDSGGNPVPVTSFEPQMHHHFPHALPDGQHFLYYVFGGPDVRGVYIARLDGSSPRRLLDADAAATYVPAGYLLFVRQGALEAQAFDLEHQTIAGTAFRVAENIVTGGFAGATVVAISASNAGPIVYRSGVIPASSRFGMSWIARSGTTLQAIPTAPNIVLNPSLSPDQRTLAYFNRSDIWLLDLQTATARKFTFDPALDFSGIWSPDNKRIVFSSNRSGMFDLFVKNADGSGGDELLLTTKEDKIPTDWSRDGSFVLYRSLGEKTSFDIWALSVADRRPFPVLVTGHEERDAQFSPNGKWVAYQSNESGRYEIWIRPFPAPGRSVKPDERWQISVGGGTQVRWARDGSEVFYLAPDGYLMSAAIRVDADERAVSAGPPKSLFMHGAPVFGGGTALPGYVPARDSQRFLVTTVAPTATAVPITVLLNWQPPQASGSAK